MQVYLLKDVENVGMAGTVVKVSEGYGLNFLIPRKLAIKITSENMGSIKKKEALLQVKSEVLNSKIAMMAEHIKSMVVTIKERIHDDGKLYGAVGATEVVELLKEKGINVDKKQIEFEKSVKAIGEHKVGIRLSSKLKPQFTLKVVGQKEARS